MKFFNTIIEAIYWFGIFLSPFFIFSVPAFIIYIYCPNLLWLSIILTCIGVISGAVIAEKIRRKYTCTAFMSQIYSTPDLYPVEVEGNLEREKEKHDKK